MTPGAEQPTAQFPPPSLRHRQHNAYLGNVVRAPCIKEVKPLKEHVYRGGRQPTQRARGALQTAWAGGGGGQKA